jgi:hypothetical protein
MLEYRKTPYLVPGITYVFFRVIPYAKCSHQIFEKMFLEIGFCTGTKDELKNYFYLVLVPILKVNYESLKKKKTIFRLKYRCNVPEKFKKKYSFEKSNSVTKTPFLGPKNLKGAFGTW